MPKPATLEQILAQHTRPGELYEKLSENRVRCFACAHRCLISDDHSGICKIRFNRGGMLFVPHGYVAGLAVDPIEKKPFYHVRPGKSALSFGMLGCDFHCDFCQNWLSSQSLRDPAAGSRIEEISAEEIIRTAKEEKVSIITSTYNEPLITSEWAVEIFKLAKHEGMICGYVSNGHGTPEVLDYLRPWMELFKIDLKCFKEDTYRRLGGHLKAVCETIEQAVAKKFWVEIVTLIVPDFNDSEAELKQIAEFIASVSKDIPWHVTAFYPTYKMTDRHGTPASALLRAVEIGQAAGLHYVYAGNLPGRVKNFENTTCPKCQHLLVERVGYDVLRVECYDGVCPSCKTPIPGVWS